LSDDDRALTWSEKLQEPPRFDSVKSVIEIALVGATQRAPRFAQANAERAAHGDAEQPTRKILAVGGWSAETDLERVL